MLTRRGGASAGRAPPKPTPRGTPGGRRRRAASLRPRTGRPPAGRASRPRSLLVSRPAAPRESAPGPAGPALAVSEATGASPAPLPAPSFRRGRGPRPEGPLPRAPPRSRAPDCPPPTPRGERAPPREGAGADRRLSPPSCGKSRGSVPTAVSQEETRASVTQFVATSSAVEALVVESGSSAVTHVPRPQQAVGSATRKTLSGA